jgi:hypothetical protein
VTAATAAAAGGALERLPLALVPDLAAALAAARSAGVRVVGVKGAGAGAGSVLPDVEGPTVFVVSAAGELERSLRARCDEVVAVGDAGLAGQVARLVASVTASRPQPEVDLPDGIYSRSQT